MKPITHRQQLAVARVGVPQLGVGCAAAARRMQTLLAHAVRCGRKLGTCCPACGRQTGGAVLRYATANGAHAAHACACITCLAHPPTKAIPPLQTAMHTRASLVAALLAAALVSASAAPAQVCVFSIATTKLASLNGAALASLYAALADIAKGAHA